MDNLDFTKNIHSLPDDIGKELVCTIIIFIPDGIEGSIQEVNDRLKDAFNKTVSFIGLSHLESEGFKTNEVNILVADYKINISDLDIIESFCKPIKVTPMSMYMKYEDLENNSKCFIGKIIPVIEPKEN